MADLSALNNPNPLVSAIDNHNVANGDPSWFEKRMDATGDVVGDIGEALTKGSVGAVVAGVNSFINSGIAVANFVGADIEQVNTYEVLKGMDNDLGKYYKDHQQGVELAGFVIGSLVPGLAGVKALQAAKAGFLGTNMARSSGLLTTLTRDYATAAKIEFATGSSPFSALNQNVVKALAQGFGAEALNSAAFETAVASTMFKSPVLEGQNASDIGWNLLTGTLIGGGIGGVLHGVGTVYGIKKAGIKIDQELFPYKHIQELDETAPSDLKLINYFQQKLNLPEPAISETATKNAVLDPAARLQLITKERDKTLDRLDTLIRSEFNRYAGGDEVIGGLLHAKFKDQKNLGDIAAALISSKSAGRITSNESLTVGDVLFPTHGMERDTFRKALASGDNSQFLTDIATKNTQGYRVIGDTSQIKVTGHGEVSGITNRDSAFAAGYDLYRNLNGTFSVNPASKILEATSARRVPNNLIVDFEVGGAIVDKATPGLADLATKAKPIRIQGDTLLAGDLNPLKVGAGKFDPLEEDYLKVQGRYLWAQEQKNIRWDGKIIDENDFPLLERAYQDGDKAKGLRIRLEDGKIVAGTTGDKLGALIERNKTLAAQKLNGRPLDEISLRLNATEKWLQGESDEFIKIAPGVDYNIPRYGRIDYPDNVHAMEMYNAAHLDGMVNYEIQKNVIQQRHNQNFANFAGSSADQFPDAPNWNDPGRTPTRAGAGASLFGFANSNYGTAGGWAQFVGTLTNRLKIEKKTETLNLLNEVAARVNTPELRSELDLIVNKLRSSPEAFVFHPAERTTLIPRKDFKAILENGTAPSESIEMSDEVADFLRTHARINAKRQVHWDNMKATAGVMSDADYDVVYAPPIDTTKYKHFVFVEPRQFGGDLTGARKRMIVAKDEKTLLSLIDQVDSNEFRVITKQDSEEYKRAVGQYDFSLGMNESAVDSSLKRKGVLSEHFAGNPSNRILDDFLDWHTRQEETLATRMVEHKYSQSFQELQHLGDRYTNIATSQFRSLTDALVEKVKDPYQDIVKTALDISRAGEYQWWRSFNQTVQQAIEAPLRQLGQIFQKGDTLSDELVDQINAKSKELGLGTPFRDTYSALVASGNIADKPFLSKYIGKAQALMSSTLLQLDFFNALNNVVSTPILLSAETRYLVNAIRESNADSAGKLALLMSVKTPEGLNGIQLPSTARLLRNAVENYRKDSLEGLGLLKRYQDIGAVTDVLQQERSMLGELAQNFGTLTAGKAEGSIARATEFGKKWTGNRLAEEMTRFVSADVMRQITDLALEAGVLKSVKEADEYIQLFVNRVQGNYLHSQRPIVFQGVVGQAVSLFQTYQFNLMQQMFKYVGEGDKKAVAMLLGLQGSIYGTQGLPAFNFLNTHIVGNASGNTQHRDLYYAANSTFGKDLGDWILYGAGSNALGLIDSRMKLNLYSRGDINPRQLTVLPTNIEDIPVVNAGVRFVRNLWTAAEKVGSGGALWPTISQAIEHNGLSRPLSGLAQIVQGYTTTNQGSLLTGGQDFWNIATVSRIAGGKPFDESVALDALYRINAYRAADLSRIQDLGSALKSSVIGGRQPTDDEVTNFAKNYAKAGGRIENFNRFMTQQMLSANRSQVNKLASNLNSPFSKQMQIIMGGVPLPDFYNSQSAQAAQ